MQQLTNISSVEIWLDKNPGITGTIPSELATVGSLRESRCASDA